jgi:hypothetical protein
LVQEKSSRQSLLKPAVSSVTLGTNRTSSSIKNKKNKVKNLAAENIGPIRGYFDNQPMFGSKAERQFRTSYDEQPTGLDFKTRDKKQRHLR